MSPRLYIISGSAGSGKTELLSLIKNQTTFKAVVAPSRRLLHQNTQLEMKERASLMISDMLTESTMRIIHLFIQ
jgi:predicted ATPase